MPMGNRQDRADATKARILTAAADEFARWGYEGARMQRIAESADANKERIYRYVGDKEALFAAVLDDAMQQITDAEPFDAEHLGEYVAAMAEFHRRHPTLIRLLLAEAQRTDGLVKREARRRHYAVRATAIADAQANGLVNPDLDPRVVLFAVQALVVTVQALSDVTDLILGADVDGQPAAVDVSRALAQLAEAITTPQASARR